MSSAENWAQMPVRDLITHHASGPSPTCEERNIQTDSEWGLLKTTAVTWDGWDSSAHKVPPEQYWGKWNLEVRQGDVLVTKAGPRHRCGVVVYVPATPPRLMVSGKMILLRPDPSKANSVYLACALGAEQPQRFLDRRTTGMADAQLNFTNELLLATEVLVPSMAVQERIAEVRSALDRAIEQTEILIAKMRQVKLGLLQDLFNRGVAPEGTLRPPRHDAPGTYRQTAIGWLPADWDVCALGSLTTKIIDGVHHTPNYVDRGVPFVTVQNLTRSRDIDFGNLNYISRLDHLEFLRRADPRPGDVLVTKDGTLGVSRLVQPHHPEFSIFVSVALLRPDTSRLLPSMLHLFFDGGAYERQLGALSAGSGLKHIHLEHFRRFLLPVPSLAEQERIASVAASIESKIAAEESQREKLVRLRSGLMRVLLSGLVPVREPGAGT